MKILVLSMSRVGRVDDVVRNVMDKSSSEAAGVERRARLRTLSYADEGGRGKDDDGLRYARVHLFKVLNDYMDVARRMGYLGQCVAHVRGGCEGEDMRKLVKKTVVRLVGFMQGEIKAFFVAVLGEDEVEAEGAGGELERGSLLNRDTIAAPSSDSAKKGIFSLSISTEALGSRPQGKAGSVRSRRRRRSSLGASSSATLVTSMSAAQFASTVLFTAPNKPSVRHALPLRKYVARWCDGLSLAVKEVRRAARSKAD